VSDESLPDNGFAILHCNILLLNIHEVRGDTFLCPSNYDYSGTAGDGETTCINQEQSLVWIPGNGTPH
jgi:hypothetical protein